MSFILGMQKFLKRNKEYILEFDNFNRLLYCNKPLTAELEEIFKIDVEFNNIKMENGNPKLDEVIKD